MSKENKSAIRIFFEGLRIYCVNIHKFILYMAFPVLGQMLGIFMVFGFTFWYSQNYQDLILKYPALKEMTTMLVFVIACSIPGLLILTKALWDYLVAYVSLNSMTEGYLNTGKVYDFKAHKAVVYKKTFSFIALWFLFGMFSIIGSIPIFWILAFIFFIYFILIFQVFTFENGLSPIGYFRRSLEITKGKFSKTLLLAALLFIVTYILLPSGFGVIFDFLNWTESLSKTFETWAYTLPLESVEQFGITPALIGHLLAKQPAYLAIIGFTLPLRSICWTLWYQNLAEPIEKPKKITRKPKKTSSKTNKLPENFKIEKRGIDPEIIRRARLEDDEY